MTEAKQPEALRLADELEREKWHVPAVVMQAAAEYLRHQHARIVELEAQLSSSGFTAADMATAAAQGFRDGVASVAAGAGSEPVAWQYRSVRNKGMWFDCTEERAKQRAAHPETWEVRYLYTHPSPPEGMVMVPREPTEAMKAAAVKYANGSAVYKNVKADVLRIEESIYGEVYEAMIAAAPPTLPLQC